VRKVPLAIGIIMMLGGVYSLWWWWQELMFSDAWLDNLFWWIVALTGGILLISFGLGVIAYAYTTSYKSTYKRIAKQKEWQVIQIPLKCPECQGEISIRSLEWIGDEEVRCPFCSKDLEIRTSKSFI
jgi:hypothetical protein